MRLVISRVSVVGCCFLPGTKNKTLIGKVSIYQMPHPPEIFAVEVRLAF